MKKNLAMCALHFTKAPHLLDHLAPLCYALDMPLLILEKNNLELVKKYYPQIKVRYFSHVHEVNPFALVDEFEIFFQTIFWSYDPIKLLSEIKQKKVLLGYAPHGHSDKGYKSKALEGVVEQDLMLVYGDHMLDQFKKMDFAKDIPPYVKTGNYRLEFYQKFLAFYDEIVEREIFSQFAKKQVTVLYAPTWQDSEKGSSFFYVIKGLIEELPTSVNLLVKCHPNLEWKNPAEYFSVADVLKKRRGNVVVLSEFPLIYPLLSKVDVYLGDFSSMGYDFLAFQKPMFFFDILKQKSLDDPSYLLQKKCGKQVSFSDPKKFYKELDQTLDPKYQKNQKELYEYTFGKVFTPPSQMLDCLEKIYQKKI